MAEPSGSDWDCSRNALMERALLMGCRVCPRTGGPRMIVHPGSFTAPCLLASRPTALVAEVTVERFGRVLCGFTTTAPSRAHQPMGIPSDGRTTPSVVVIGPGGSPSQRDG